MGRSGLEGAGLSRWQRGLYGLGVVLLRYIWARADQFSASQHWGDLPRGCAALQLSSLCCICTASLSQLCQCPHCCSGKLSVFCNWRWRRRSLCRPGWVREGGQLQGHGGSGEQDVESACGGPAGRGDGWRGGGCAALRRPSSSRRCSTSWRSCALASTGERARLVPS